uniref:Uncharacterized protein n=1 Tax=Lepeophtheirus salmonis TaxID=72036 RepID=A0A0K2V0W7_LEPSM
MNDCILELRSILFDMPMEFLNTWKFVDIILFFFFFRLDS